MNNMKAVFTFIARLLGRRKQEKTRFTPEELREIAKDRVVGAAYTLAVFNARYPASAIPFRIEISFTGKSCCVFTDDNAHLLEQMKKGEVAFHLSQGSSEEMIWR